MLKKIFLIFILTLFMHSLWSATDKKNEEEKEKPMFTETVEVIGEVPLNQSVQSVTLYKIEDLPGVSGEGLKSILNLTAGYLTLSSGHYGQFSYSFARGASVNQTLYMIDGIKITDPSTSLGLNLTFLSPQLLEKAEIVRGPLSSLYGSNAMGGVVNLKPREKEGGSAAIFFGSRGTYKANANVSKKWHRFTLSVNGSISRYNDELENDEFKNNGLTARLGYKSDKLKTALVLFGSFADSGIPIYLGQPTPNRNYLQDNLIVGVPVSISFSPVTKLDIKLSHNTNRYEFSDPDDEWNPYYINKSFVNEALVNLGTKIKRKINLDIGINYSDQKVLNRDQSSTSVDNEKTHYFSAYASTALNLESLLLTASIRYDKYKDIDANISPQFGVSYLVNRWFKLRGSYSRSFRAPTLPELINPLWGNPNLEPETGSSFEVGTDIFLKKATLSIVYFNSNYKNLIGYNPTSWTFDNINEADISGIEVSANLKLIEKIDFIAAYTYLDTYDIQSDRELLRRPKHSFSLLLAYNNPYFTISGEMVYVGRRLDYDELDWLNPIAENPAFDTFNFNLKIPVNEKLAMVGTVTNAFNREYQEVLGYPAPGSRFTAGIVYNFNFK